MELWGCQIRIDGDGSGEACRSSAAGDLVNRCRRAARDLGGMNKVQGLCERKRVIYGVIGEGFTRLVAQEAQGFIRHGGCRRAVGKGRGCFSVCLFMCVGTAGRFSIMMSRVGPSRHPLRILGWVRTRSPCMGSMFFPYHKIGPR